MHETLPALDDVIRELESWAPPGAAQSYDNVGLQVGHRDRTVETCIVALDLTPAVIDEATATGAQLIITHHPLLFRPLRTVSTDNVQGALTLRLAESGIALYSIHTNLDSVVGGVSYALAEQLGLEEISTLSPLDQSLIKLVTFVPASHLEQVREALAAAGAGRIGDYDSCAFTTEGTGYFRPGEEANPFIGKPAGDLESVQEVRIEVEVLRWDVSRVLASLRAAHPYEEVAYDLYPVEQPASRFGLGAAGHLKEPESLTDFLRRVADALGQPGLRYVGNPEATIKKVAVCGGAGSDLIGAAIRAGADAYVTADLTYHRFFDVLDSDGNVKMALIDAGHYETEAVTERLIVERLSKRFPQVRWKRTGVRTSPIRTYTGSSI